MVRVATGSPVAVCQPHPFHAPPPFPSFFQPLLISCTASSVQPLKNNRNNDTKDIREDGAYRGGKKLMAYVWGRWLSLTLCLRTPIFMKWPPSTTRSHKTLHR